MKILCCGDSWTVGFGVAKDKAWPAILQKLTGHQIDVLAKCGATNSEIANFYLKHPKYPDRIKNNLSYDLVIFCWSGVTRKLVGDHVFEFSPSPNNAHLKTERFNFFKDKSLDNLIEDWQLLIDEVDSFDTVKKIHFNVFGDQPKIKKDNFYNNSFLEFLAETQGIKFKHQIPIFEFGWLTGDNYDLVEQFAKSYFPRNWLRAIVEREDIKPGKYFLSCGHPNERGHKLWAKHIAGII